MRLWHQALILTLPKERLLAQHRAVRCAAIDAGRAGVVS